MISDEESSRDEENRRREEMRREDQFRHAHLAQLKFDKTLLYAAVFGYALIALAAEAVWMHYTLESKALARAPDIRYQPAPSATVPVSNAQPSSVAASAVQDELTRGYFKMIEENRKKGLNVSVNADLTKLIDSLAGAGKITMEEASALAKEVTHGGVDVAVDTLKKITSRVFEKPATPGAELRGGAQNTMNVALTFPSTAAAGPPAPQARPEASQVPKVIKKRTPSVRCP